MKQFGKKHSDSVGNIKIASYEGKQFATAVQEAKQMLLRVLENGSKKQIFISQYKVRHQMLDHVDRLFDLNIWDGVHDYNQHDADFLRPNIFKMLVFLKCPLTHWKHCQILLINCKTTKYCRDEQLCLGKTG